MGSLSDGGRWPAGAARIMIQGVAYPSSGIAVRLASLRAEPARGFLRADILLRSAQLPHPPTSIPRPGAGVGPIRPSLASGRSSQEVGAGLDVGAGVTSKK